MVGNEQHDDPVEASITRGQVTPSAWEGLTPEERARRRAERSHRLAEWEASKRDRPRPTVENLPIKWSGVAYLRPVSRGITINIQPLDGDWDFGESIDLDDWLLDQVPDGYYRMTLTVEPLDSDSASAE